MIPRTSYSEKLHALDASDLVKVITGVRRCSKSSIMRMVREPETWAKTIDALRAEYGLNIYATGSNARMFAGEGILYLSGRYVIMEVYPRVLITKDAADHFQEGVVHLNLYDFLMGAAW